MLKLAMICIFILSQRNLLTAAGERTSYEEIWNEMIPTKKQKSINR